MQELRNQKASDGVGSSKMNEINLAISIIVMSLFSVLGVAIYFAEKDRRKNKK